MTVTAKGLDGSSGEGVEEEDTSAGFVKYCPIVLITKQILLVSLPGRILTLFMDFFRNGKNT